MKILSILVLISFKLLTIEAMAKDQNDQCLNMIPEIERGFNGLKVIPGAIPGQIQINKEASGLNRFETVGETLLMDAERFPLLSKKRKEIYPIESLEGFVFEGLHIAGKTNRTMHNGIEIFDMRLSSEENEILSIFRNPTHPYFLPYYFKNFKLEPTPFVRDSLEGPTWILKHQEDRNQRWSHHSFLYSSNLQLPEDTILNLYFETDFDNYNDGNLIMNWIENSTSGVRIDTCVYFLVRKPN